MHLEKAYARKVAQHLGAVIAVIMVVLSFWVNLELMDTETIAADTLRN